VGNQAVWARQIETYLDTENIGPDPAWGENGAMDGAAPGSYRQHLLALAEPIHPLAKQAEESGLAVHDVPVCCIERVSGPGSPGFLGPPGSMIMLALLRISKKR
jgi:hypothetical protein